MTLPSRLNSSVSWLPDEDINVWNDVKFTARQYICSVCQAVCSRCLLGNVCWKLFVANLRTFGHATGGSELSSPHCAFPVLNG